jgi:hypothetical protein
MIAQDRRPWGRRARLGPMVPPPPDGRTHAKTFHDLMVGAGYLKRVARCEKAVMTRTRLTMCAPLDLANANVNDKFNCQIAMASPAGVLFECVFCW